MLPHPTTPTVYINLEHRADRRVQIEHELRQVWGLTQVVRLPATRRQPGFEGCTESHIRALQLLRAWPDVQPDDWVQVFEDDFVLWPDRPVCYPDVTTEVVLWGSRVVRWGPTKGHGWREVRCSLTSSGYAVRWRYIPTLLACLREAWHYRVPLDVHWQRWQARGGWVASPAGHQRPSYSDIEEREVAY